MDISLIVYSIYYLYKGALSSEVQLVTKNTREINYTIINHKINWKKERQKRWNERKKTSKLWKPIVYCCY